MPTPRVLFAITVYNGRDFVPACLRSAAAMAPVDTEVDLIVLDDASPEPGFSAEIEALCSDLGVQYYRTPRNLGIPRNVNMGLLRAMDAGYDYVVIANSDVIFSERLTDSLMATALSDPTIGSVTSWSNNVSMFSLPNEDPDRFVSSQATVNWLGDVLRSTFEDQPIDIPAGISFSFMVPVPVLREVGLMDPIFGRGYCEETDWSLRSLSMGYRIVLSPSSFTYHRGGGTNVAAGLVSDGHTTVPEHEEIIDMRWPEFRSQVGDFVAAGALDAARARAAAALIQRAAERDGYSVAMGIAARGAAEAGPIVTLGVADGTLAATARYRGFTCEVECPNGFVDGLVAFFGREPTVVELVEPYVEASDLAERLESLGARVNRTVCYPTRI